MGNREYEVKNDDDDEHFHHTAVLFSSAHRGLTVVFVNSVVAQAADADEIEVGYDEEGNHPSKTSPHHQIDLVAFIRNAEIHSPGKWEFDTSGKDPGTYNCNHLCPYLDSLPANESRYSPGKQYV